MLLEVTPVLVLLSLGSTLDEKVQSSMSQLSVQMDGYLGRCLYWVNLAVLLVLSSTEEAHLTLGIF